MLAIGKSKNYHQLDTKALIGLQLSRALMCFDEIGSRISSPKRVRLVQFKTSDTVCFSVMYLRSNLKKIA
jgi:hypothetical protein